MVLPLDVPDPKMAKPHGLNPFDRAGTTVKRVFYWSFEMDKMREGFEVFMANPHWSWATGDIKEELYCLWQASRADLCVELPSFENGSVRGYSGDCEEARMVIDCVAESLEAAGVSYK